MIFSEESSRINHELGNIELYESGQKSSTSSSIRAADMQEGLNFCPRGMCLRLDEAAMKRIHARFQTLIVPYYFARMNIPRAKSAVNSQWPQDRQKARGRHKRCQQTWQGYHQLSQSGGKVMSGTETRS